MYRKGISLAALIGFAACGGGEVEPVDQPSGGDGIPLEGERYPFDLKRMSPAQELMLLLVGSAGIDHPGVRVFDSTPEPWPVRPGEPSVRLPDDGTDQI